MQLAVYKATPTEFGVPLASERPKPLGLRAISALGAALKAIWGWRARSGVPQGPNDRQIAAFAASGAAFMAISG